jgi:guanylate kinase
MTQPSSQTGKLVLLIGPSGVGKSVILQALRQKHPEWHFPRSATTRTRRQSEGDDLYLFVSDHEFDRLLSDGEILEWAVVHDGPRYGTLVGEIVPRIEEGKIVVREVDVQGFDSIRRHALFSGPGAPYVLQTVFILPENKKQLVERITKRAPISQEELDCRLASMEKELTYANLCDAAVSNVEGKLREAVSAVERLVVS